MPPACLACAPLCVTRPRSAEPGFRPRAACQCQTLQRRTELSALTREQQGVEDTQKFTKSRLTGLNRLANASLFKSYKRLVIIKGKTTTSSIPKTAYGCIPCPPPARTRPLSHLRSLLGEPATHAGPGRGPLQVVGPRAATTLLRGSSPRPQSVGQQSLVTRRTEPPPPNAGRHCRAAFCTGRHGLGKFFVLFPDL